MTDLRIAYYGDDVTGSVDVLLQFARHGAHGRLFVGAPDAAVLAAAALECPVVGIAGIARSLGADELDAELVPAFEALGAIDPDVVQYKACSTADSSPTVGRLGRVIELGRELFGERPVPMLFAQPDFGRYTAFGHHFAAEGGVVHRLDRQPTMSTHPSTPMDESDLAMHIARQTALPIGALPFTAYSSATAVTEALQTSSHAAVVLDALDDAHLALVGIALVALDRPLFAIGSGGLSRALALASRRGDPRSAPVASLHLPTTGTGSPPVVERSIDSLSPAQGGSSRDGTPTLVVSGSRSAQTRRQVEAAAAAGFVVRRLPLDGESREVVDALSTGRSVVLTSDDETVDGDALAAIAGAAAAIIAATVHAGATSRIVVCGGDTSGRVVRLLKVTALSIAANPEGNVVLLRAHAEDPAVDGLELLLKGGQVGADDLLVRVSRLVT